MKSKKTNKGTIISYDERILEKGERAPFYGILTPPDRYSTYQQELAACEYLKEDYIACSAPEEESPSTWDHFLYGALVGVVATAALTLGMGK